MRSLVSGSWARFGEARNRLKEANSLVSEASEMRMHLDFAEANLSMGEGRNREALRQLEKILSGHPRLLNTPNHRFLYDAIQERRAILLVTLERCEEALPILEEAVSSDSDNATLCYYLGHCYCTLGKDLEHARKRLIRALEVGLPKDLTFLPASL